MLFLNRGNFLCSFYEIVLTSTFVDILSLQHTKNNISVFDLNFGKTFIVRNILKYMKYVIPFNRYGGLD